MIDWSSNQLSFIYPITLKPWEFEFPRSCFPRRSRNKPQFRKVPWPHLSVSWNFSSVTYCLAAEKKRYCRLNQKPIYGEVQSSMCGSFQIFHFYISPDAAGLQLISSIKALNWFFLVAGLLLQAQIFGIFWLHFLSQNCFRFSCICQRLPPITLKPFQSFADKKMNFLIPS